MDGSDITILGVSGIALVMSIVQVAKIAGLPRGKEQLTALIAGLGVALLYVGIDYFGWLAVFARVLIVTLALGFGAIGMHQIATKKQEVTEKQAIANLAKEQAEFEARQGE